MNCPQLNIDLSIKGLSINKKNNIDHFKKNIFLKRRMWKEGRKDFLNAWLPQMDVFIFWKEQTCDDDEDNALLEQMSHIIFFVRRVKMGSFCSKLTLLFLSKFIALSFFPMAFKLLRIRGSGRRQRSSDLYTAAKKASRPMQTKKAISEF